MAIPHTFISIISIFLFLFLCLCQISTASPECARVYGSHINYADCRPALALFDMKVRMEIAGSNPATTFMLSRDPRLATGMRQMRQIITHGTCGIGLDMTDPLPVTGRALSSWRAFKNHILATLQTCVTQPGAIGGVYKFGAFEVTILNPQEEAVRNILAMPQTSRLSLSTSIRTESMDLKLKQDAETGISSPRGSHSRPHAAPQYPPQLAPNIRQPALRPHPQAPYPFPQAPSQAHPNVAHGPFHPSQEAHLATLNQAFLQNLRLHGTFPSAQNPVPPPPDRPAAPFQGLSRGPRPAFPWRAPSFKGAGAPVMEHYRSKQPRPFDQGFASSVL